jgi:hypothetical protein
MTIADRGDRGRESWAARLQPIDDLGFARGQQRARLTEDAQRPGLASRGDTHRRLRLVAPVG